MSGPSRYDLERGLAAVYSAAVEQPGLVVRAADAHLCWPEASEVLSGAFESLWHTIVTPDDADEAPIPLGREQRAWFLVHAGLLRGFNLAAITAWRPSGDSLDSLDDLYPGFLRYGAALHASCGSPLSAAPGDDSRDAFERSSREGQRLLRIGLGHGYGLGFLVDAALEAQSRSQPDGDPVAALEDIAGGGNPDDAGLVAVAETWTAGQGVPTRPGGLASLFATCRSADEVESAAASASRARPLAVPSSIGRFSASYVVTMLAYLIEWWATLGIRLEVSEDAGLSGLPSPAAPWGRYRVRHWLRRQSYRWARAEVVEVRAQTGDPIALRWHLARLARTMAAVGWQLARELTVARPYSQKWSGFSR